MWEKEEERNQGRKKKAVETNVKNDSKNVQGGQPMTQTEDV